MAKYSKQNKRKDSKQQKKQQRKKQKKQQPQLNQQSSSSLTWIFLAGVVVLTAICYFPVLNHEFVNIDDGKFIAENPLVQNSTFADVGKVFSTQISSPHYKPLVYLSWIAEKQLFGPEPFTFHLNNLLLHLINCMLLFFIILRISNYWESTKKYAPQIAFFSALIFGIHPMHVESVAWAVERKDVLFTFFYFAGLIAYLEYLREKKYIWMLVTAAAYLGSILSKSPGITLPAVLLLIDYASGRELNAKLITEKIPVLLIMLVGFALFGLFGDLKDPKTQAIEEYSENQEYIRQPSNLEGASGFYTTFVILNYRLLFFALHLLVPIKLSIVYPRAEMLEALGPGIHAIVLINLLLVAAVFWFGRKSKTLLFGALFYAITISPALAISDIGTNFLPDRYTYIPSIGVFFLLIVGLIQLMEKRMPQNKIVSQVVLGVISLAFLIGCFQRVQVWENSETLWDASIKNYERLPIAYNNRGLYKSNAGDLQGALNDFNSAIKQGNNYFMAYSNRGNIFFKLGKLDAAFQDHDYAVKLQPQSHLVYGNRGMVYAQRQEIEKAFADLNKALSIKENYPEGLLNRAVLYDSNNEDEKALADYNKYLSLTQGTHWAYGNRGTIYMQKGNHQAAIQDYSKAIQLDPQNGNYYHARAFCYGKTGNRPAWQQDMARAQQLGVKIDPSVSGMFQ